NGSRSWIRNCLPIRNPSTGDGAAHDLAPIRTKVSRASGEQSVSRSLAARLRHANHQSLYFFAGAWASWSALVMAIVLLARSVCGAKPTRYPCDQGGDFGQKLASQPFGSDGEASALVIIEAHPTITVLLP